MVTTRGAAPDYETPNERKQRKAAMKPVQNVITRRRWLYFALLLTSLGYLASPYLLGCINASQCTTVNGLLDPLLEMAMNRLPDFAAPWIRVLRHSPMILYCLILLFGLLSVMKDKAWTQTQQLAANAWAALKKK